MNAQGRAHGTEGAARHPKWKRGRGRAAGRSAMRGRRAARSAPRGSGPQGESRTDREADLGPGSLAQVNPLPASTPCAGPGVQTRRSTERAPRAGHPDGTSLDTHLALGTLLEAHTRTGRRRAATAAHRPNHYTERRGMRHSDGKGSTAPDSTAPASTARPRKHGSGAAASPRADGPTAGSPGGRCLPGCP